MRDRRASSVARGTMARGTCPFRRALPIHNCSRLLCGTYRVHESRCRTIDSIWHRYIPMSFKLLSSSAASTSTDRLTSHSRRMRAHQLASGAKIPTRSVVRVLADLVDSSCAQWLPLRSIVTRIDRSCALVSSKDSGVRGLQKHVGAQQSGYTCRKGVSSGENQTDGTRREGPLRVGFGPSACELTPSEADIVQVATVVGI
jgi:hypothetical protein